MLFAITLSLTIKGEPYSLEMRTARAQTCLLVDVKGQNWAFAPKRLNPWQIRAGDLDGNGKMDFMLGVFKGTNLIKTPHRTIFIYEFTGEEVKPKWKGSTIGRDFIDFNFAQLEGPRMIIVEIDLDGRHVLSEWKWAGFGIRKLSELARGKDIRLTGIPWADKTISATVDGEPQTWRR